MTLTGSCETGNFYEDNSVSTGKRIAKKQNKDAIGALKALIRKMENGELYVENFGGWAGTEGKYNFSITLKEAEIPRLSEELEK